MPRLSHKLVEIRDIAIMNLWINQQATAEEIGKIFDLTTSQVYYIIKEKKGK